MISGCSWNRTRLSVAFMALSLVGSMGLAGCRSAEEEAQSISRGITGTLSITGTVFDARGNGLPGVTVRLSGSSQATVVTGASGAYAFNGFGPLTTHCVDTTDDPDDWSAR